MRTRASSAGGSSPSSPGRATSPITITAGLRTCASSAARTARSRVVRVVRWSGVCPFSTIATGLSAGTPWARAAATRAGSVRTPISTTVVMLSSASAARVAGDGPCGPAAS